MSEIFTEAQLAIIKFCAKECELQQSGELSVGWMLEAWTWAFSHASAEVEHYDVEMLGQLIEPAKNKDGYRQVGVRVGWSVKMDWQQVEGALTGLLAAQESLTPEEWFREFEEIHPFRDGNGRTGQILYNWLRGSLDAPVFAPNFWADERREGLATADSAAGNV